MHARPASPGRVRHAKPAPLQPPVRGPAPLKASGGSRTSRGGNVGKVTGTGIGTTATVADNMGVMLLLGGSVLFAAGGVYALRRRPA